MNLSRHNSFNLIHKGLRNYLYDTALKLQRADLSSKTESTPVMGQLKALLDLFEFHASGEDQYWNEPLEKIKPEVSKLFEREHEEDHRLAKVLTSQLESWEAAETPEDRARIGAHLFYTFNEFVAFNLHHMNKEEILLNEALWEVYSDQEILATEQELVKNIPPAKLAESMKRIIGGINNPEAIAWIGGIKRNAPPEVYQRISTLAMSELSAERWVKIEKAIFMADLQEQS